MSVRIVALSERDPGVAVIFFSDGRTVTLDTRVALATLTDVLGGRGARWLGRRVEYQLLSPAPGGVYTRLAMTAAPEPTHHWVQGN